MTEAQATEMLQHLIDINATNQFVVVSIAVLIGSMIACAIAIIVGVWLRDI